MVAQFDAEKRPVDGILYCIDLAQKRIERDGARKMVNGQGHKRFYKSIITVNVLMVVIGEFENRSEPK